MSLMKLLPWQRRPSSLMLLHVLSPEEKAVQICLYFPASDTIQAEWQKPRDILSKQWQTLEEHGLELLRSRTDELRQA